MKKCASCKELKPLTSYTKNSTRKDGLEYYCVECRSLKRRGPAPKRSTPPFGVAKQTVCNLHKTIILPDMHVPEHDEHCVRGVLEFIKHFKPDRLVQLGDFCDYDSLSKHDYACPEDVKTLDEELTAAHEMLDRIESVLPSGCEKFMVGGNHEDRWHKARVQHNDLPKKVKTTLKKLAPSWGTELRLTQRGWSWCEYTGRSFDISSHPDDHFRLGKIVFTHGKYTGSTCAKKMAEQFPGHNVIFGHTHGRYIHGSIDDQRFPVEAESIGTLSKFDLSYLRGKKPTNWVHGFATIYTRKSGLFQKVFTHIISGKFIVNGRKYGERGLIEYPDERSV